MVNGQLYLNSYHSFGSGEGLSLDKYTMTENMFEASRALEFFI